MDRDKVLNLKDPPNETRDQVINAGVMAGLGFFTALAGIGAAGLLGDPAAGLLAAGISAGLEFFIALAVQRGLYKKPEETS